MGFTSAAFGVSIGGRHGESFHAYLRVIAEYITIMDENGVIRRIEEYDENTYDQIISSGASHFTVKLHDDIKCDDECTGCTFEIDCTEEAIFEFEHMNVRFAEQESIHVGDVPSGCGLMLYIATVQSSEWEMFDFNVIHALENWRLKLIQAGRIPEDSRYALAANCCS